MTTPPVGVERRIGQRFGFNLPVSLRDISSGVEGLGFTQDLSSRGVFLFTDMAIDAGAEIELTLKMPSEVTLGENMRVRCRGRVLRIVKPPDHAWMREALTESNTKLTAANSAETRSAETRSAETRSAETRSAETKIGVAVCLNGYEYLPETEDDTADFRRISALHGGCEAERPVAAAPAAPRAVH